MNKTKEKRYVYIIVFVIFILLTTSTYAYYTDHHATMNEFTVGQVKISLTEPQYDTSSNAGNRTSIPPNHTIVKDPTVKNTGKSDCYLFMEVDIPRTTRPFVDSAGQKLPREWKDIFTYTVNPGWILVSETVDDTIRSPYTRRTYAYAKETVLTPLAPNKSVSLFQNGTIKSENFIETGTEYDQNFNIPVRAYAIQTTDIVNTDKANDIGVTNPTQVFNIIKNQLHTEGRI